MVGSVRSHTPTARAVVHSHGGMRAPSIGVWHTQRRRAGRRPVYRGDAGGTRSRAIDVELCRHQQERARGAVVLTVLGSPEVDAADFARWASVQGTPVVPVGAGSLEQVARTLLAGLPHRTLRDPACRMLAEWSRRTAEELIAGLAARTPHERRQWLLELIDGSPTGALAAWLVEQGAEGGLGPSAPPLAIEALLPAVAALAEPFAVLVAPPPEDQAKLAAAVRVAAALAEVLRPHAVALAAPRGALEVLLVASQGASASLARQGLVCVPPSGVGVPTVQGRSAPERELHAALERDPRTRGRFALSYRLTVTFHGQPAEVDLYDAAVRFAVEVDGWHHFREPEGYRRDRANDLALQRAGVLVLRVLAEDVRDRLDQIVDQIASALQERAQNIAAASAPHAR